MIITRSRLPCRLLFSIRALRSAGEPTILNAVEADDFSIDRLNMPSAAELTKGVLSLENTPEKKDSPKKASLLVMSGASLWGLIGIFAKRFTAIGLTAIEAVALRVTSAALLMGLLLLIRNRSLLRIRLRDIPLFFGTGIVSLLTFNWCYFKAMELTSLSVAVVLLYTSPIFIMLFSALLFQEKLTGRKLLALALTMGGCILVTGLAGAGESLSIPGLLFGLASGLTYGLYSIFGRYALKKYASPTVTFYTFLFAALGALPLSGLYQVPELVFRPDTLLNTLGIGIFCCILPYLLYTRGLASLETGKAAVLATLEPVVATLLGVLVYHESITLMKLLGMAAIFGAILLLNQKTAVKPVVPQEDIQS